VFYLITIGETIGLALRFLLVCLDWHENHEASAEIVIYFTILNGSFVSTPLPASSSLTFMNRV